MYVLFTYVQNNDQIFTKTNPHFETNMAVIAHLYIMKSQSLSLIHSLTFQYKGTVALRLRALCLDIRVSRFSSDM